MPDSSPQLSVEELIFMIARGLVDRPEEVSINSAPSKLGILMQLRVDPSDTGKIIGKQGRMARSLRTLLEAISVKLKSRYSLEIIENMNQDVQKT